MLKASRHMDISSMKVPGERLSITTERLPTAWANFTLLYQSLIRAMPLPRPRTIIAVSLCIWDFANLLLLWEAGFSSWSVSAVSLK